MKADRQYVRVYHDDLKRDYGAIWADNDALATWLRLLVIADKMWPTEPELPRSVKSAPLARLVDCGLVELLPAHCFRIRGHDTERSKRQESARNAAALRWQSDSNATGNAEVMPRPRPSRDEPNTPPPQVGRRKDGTNPRATGTNPRATGTSPRQEREKEKRGPSALHEILSSIQTGKTA